MELMKESRIGMFWKVFYCQMECKISDFGVILSGLRCHGQELSNCSTKQRLVLRAFYLVFFPSLQYYTACWDIWSHCGKVMESPRMRWGGSGKLPATRSALHRGCVREVQDVQSPLPECIRYEKCLCATYCSVQLITGWKKQGPGYSPKDTNVWLFNSFGPRGPLVGSGLPAWSQVQINTQSAQVICHPESHMEFKWQPLTLRTQHLCWGTSVMMLWLILI